MAVQDGFSDPGITNNSKIRTVFSGEFYFPSGTVLDFPLSDQWNTSDQ